MKSEKEIELDNIFSEAKKEIDDNYKKIDSKKKQIKNYDALEEKFKDIKDSFNRLSYYLNKSVKGERVNRLTQDIEKTVQGSDRRISSIANEGRDNCKTELKNLYDKVGELEENLKNIYKEVDNKDNEEVEEEIM